MSEEKQDSVWPLPKFSFEVDFGNELSGVSFQEVLGLESDVDPIEYRHGNNPVFAPIKMPGIVKYGNVTLKRGIFVKDNTFWNWYNDITMNTIKRSNVIIKLLGENGDVTMMWTLKNAWPVKISATDLKSDGNEVAIDTIEIALEELVISNGG